MLSTDQQRNNPQNIFHGGQNATATRGDMIFETTELRTGDSSPKFFDAAYDIDPSLAVDKRSPLLSTDFSLRTDEGTGVVVFLQKLHNSSPNLSDSVRDPSQPSSVPSVSSGDVSAQGFHRTVVEADNCLSRITLALRRRGLEDSLVDAPWVSIRSLQSLAQQLESTWNEVKATLVGQLPVGPNTSLHSAGNSSGLSLSELIERAQAGLDALTTRVESTRDRNIFSLISQLQQSLHYLALKADGREELVFSRDAA